MAAIKVAIAGFSGKMARLITQALLKRHPDVQIHGLARSPEKIDASVRDNANVKVFKADSKDEWAIREAIRGTNIVICCYLGDDSVMFDGQKLLIDACVAEGVPRYMSSDWSFEYTALKPNDHPGKNFALKVNDYLKEQEKLGKIKSVHVLCGAFMEVIFAPFIGFTDGQGSFFYYGSGDEPLELTTMPDTAEYTAEVAADPEAVGWIRFLGDRKSVKQLAQIYEELYNVKTTVTARGSQDDLRKAKEAAIAKDPQNMYAWMGLAYQQYMIDGSTYLVKLDNDRYPAVKPSDVKQFLGKYTKDTLANAYVGM